MSQPTVAPTIGALLTAIEPSVSLAGDALSIDDEAALRASGVRDLAWTATFTDDEATRDAARWIVAEAASQRLRLSLDPRALRGSWPGRDRRFHCAGAEPAHPGLRHGLGDVPAAAARRRHGHLRAGPQRDGLHPAAPRRVRHQRAGGGIKEGHRRRSSSRATTIRSTPRTTRRLRGDDRGAARADPRGDRGRLRQHRHRYLDARRLSPSDARRAAARQLAPRASSPRSSASSSRPG